MTPTPHKNMRRKIVLLVGDLNTAADQMVELSARARDPKVVLQLAGQLSRIAILLLAEEAFGRYFREAGDE